MLIQFLFRFERVQGFCSVAGSRNHRANGPALLQLLPSARCGGGGGDDHAWWCCTSGESDHHHHWCRWSGLHKLGERKMA